MPIRTHSCGRLMDSTFLSHEAQILKAVDSCEIAKMQHDRLAGLARLSSCLVLLLVPNAHEGLKLNAAKKHERVRQIDPLGWS